MKLNLPTGLTVALSAASGVIVAFVASNIIIVQEPWAAGIKIGLTILGAWGISPLTGVAFRAILHLSNGVCTGIAAGLTALQLIFIQAHLTAGLHGVFAGLIAFAAGLGFAPAINLANLPAKHAPANTAQGRPRL